VAHLRRDRSEQKRKKTRGAVNPRGYLGKRESKRSWDRERWIGKPTDAKNGRVDVRSDVNIERGA